MRFVLKPWLLRITKIIVIAQVIYLVLINAALNIPLTQTLINQIKPDKFEVTWQRAWSLYPFHVDARGIDVNGQAESQQWQMQSPAASASISLLSLLWRSVELRNIKARDVKYYQRPRPKPENNYNATSAWFPPIKGRVLETHAAVAQPGKKSSKPWHINIRDINAKGQHELWLYQIQGKLAGELQTDLSFQTKGGPFSLSNGQVDVDLQSMVINGNHEVIRGGHLKGEVEFLPFVPRENKGINSLQFLAIDAEVETETESLAYLNIYLANFEGMRVDGAGLVQGRLHLQQGELRQGTDIKVSARELSLNLLDIQFEGDGNISIKAADNEEVTDVAIAFISLDAFAGDKKVKLFSGDGLTVKARGNRFILPMKDKSFEAKTLTVIIPGVTVPDLSAYQLFIPSKWPFTLHGGEGKLLGTVELTPTGYNGNLRLRSEDADIGIKEYRFASNLDMALMVDSPTLSSGVDISGTYAHLFGARLSNDEGKSSEPWHARIDFEQGKLKLLLPEGVPDDAGIRQFYQGLKGKEIVTMIDSGDEEIQIKGSISDLAWINVLLKNRLGLALTGSGEVSADILLNKGWAAPGTRLAIHPQALGVEVLDYLAEGDGEITLLVKKGGETPDALLNIALDDGTLRRKDEDQAFIENVSISLDALARSISFDGKTRDMDLRLQIPSAEIRDMSVYNQYLPEDSPLQFTSGTAGLTADIKLTPETADGYVKLKTRGFTAQVDQQEIEGELNADLTLIDGVPENMNFDISGSIITLDNVRVTGKERNHDDEDWSARFELTKARAMWKRPVTMHLEANLAMTDSKPIVAVIANQRGKHGWLGKALTIDDVKGKVVINARDNQIIIPYAYAKSDKIDVGAKGIITADNRDGVLYVRFRKLHGILKINNGKRNLDVLNAKKKFYAYDSDAVFSEFSTGNTQ